MCDNGECILESELCNEVKDCDDGSDEASKLCPDYKNEGWSILIINNDRMNVINVKSNIKLSFYLMSSFFRPRR